MKVKIIQKYGVLSIGDVITVKAHSDNSKVLVWERKDGIPVYVPKIITELIETGDDSDDTTAYASSGKPPVFDKHNMTSVTVPTDLSDAEMKVLESLNKGEAPPPSDTDGPTTETSFTPDSGVTIQEKAREAALAKTRAARRQLAQGASKAAESRLKEGQFWLSDLTQGNLPDSGVDHVITTHVIYCWAKDSTTGKWEIQPITDNPWFDSMAMADIPDIALTYIWQPNVLECILIGDKLNERILLSGPPGTGKTTALRQFAAWTDHPFMRFNGKDGIEQSTFLGYNSLSYGTMEWKDGLLPIGLKLGYIICLDEVFKIPPGIQMALQSLYEKNGTLVLDEKAGSLHEKTVVPTPEARLFCTDNVKGMGDASDMFAATQMQDSSTIDRFGMTVDVDYLDKEDEKQMLKGLYPGADSRVIKRLVQFANLVRSGYKKGSLSLTLSPRGLQAVLDMVTTQKLSEEHALRYAYINKIGEDTEVNEVQQHINTVW